MKKTIVLALFLVSIAAVVTYIALSGRPVEARPQEPKLPYPYYSEDVTFRNDQANIMLSGTLTLPQKSGQYPAVVLITGSGAQNRDENIFGHKPFLVIADYLTRQGFAVLRYDDRGVGKSSGNFMAAISPDFAADAESAVAYLKTRKEIRHDKIGLAGHSEGGLVAAIAASRSRDVAFIISLAGPGVTGIDVISLQAELIARAGGVDEAGIAIINKASRETAEILRNTPDTTLLRAKLTNYAQTNLKNYPSQMLPPGQSRDEFIKGQIYAMCSPWYQYVYKVEPATFFEKVTCPVLVLNGSKDLQVDARQNLPAISKALKDGGNARVTVKELRGLNHLFQKCKSGHPNEYREIRETFSNDALQIMADWITAQTK